MLSDTLILIPDDSIQIEKIIQKVYLKKIMGSLIAQVNRGYYIMSIRICDHFLSNLKLFYIYKLSKNK